MSAAQLIRTLAASLAVWALLAALAIALTACGGGGDDDTDCTAASAAPGRTEQIPTAPCRDGAG